MDEQNDLKSVKNKCDLKLDTYQALNTAIESVKSGEIEEVSIDQNTEVFIFTSFGSISGTYISKKAMDDVNSQNNISKVFCHIMLSKVFESTNENLEQLKSQNVDLKLINDSSAIILENATITPYSNPNNKINLQYFIIFSDEIKGLSFGQTH